MSVHYKFKSSLDYDTITFDGLHISVADLKQAIIQQKRLGKALDFDLQITNAQTKEAYNDDSALIPKNTSLVIARIPVTSTGKKNFDINASEKQIIPRAAAVDSANVDLSKMGGSEEDKINAMMQQSTIDYDPSNYQKIRGQVGEVPPTYKCHRCHKPGHWIKNCPLGPFTKENAPEVKRNTGIPRSFLEKGKEEVIAPVPAPVIEKPEIPEDLICSICKDLYNDAVMIPCCGSSFCDDCIRTSLIESEDNECPDCFEKGTPPGSLIPNRFLRNSVNTFKKETGYIVTRVGKTSTRVPPDSNTANEEVTSSNIEVIDTVPEHVEEKEETEVPESDTNNDHEDLDEDDNYEATDKLNRQVQHKQSIDTISSHSYNDSNYTENISNVVNSAPHMPNMHQQNDYIPHRVPPQNVMPNYGGMVPQHHNPIMPQRMNYGNAQMNPNSGYPPIRGYHGHVPNYARPPYQPRGYGHIPPNHRPRHVQPYSNISAIYEGVAQQVGTGVIDDPLEAFNRIMREKERKKEEHNKRSPIYDRDRERDRDRNVGRDFNAARRRRRSRSYEKDRRRSPFYRKRRRSGSNSPRSSRSKSRSRTPKRRSITPQRYSKSPKRRSRTPSPYSRSNRRHDTKRVNNYDQQNKGNRRGRSPNPRDNYKHRSPQRERSRPRHFRRQTRSPQKVNQPEQPYPEPSNNQNPNYDREMYDNDYKHAAPNDFVSPPPNDNNSIPADLAPPGVETVEKESWLLDSYKTTKENSTSNASNEVPKSEKPIIDRKSYTPELKEEKKVIESDGNSGEKHGKDKERKRKDDSKKDKKTSKEKKKKSKKEKDSEKDAKKSKKHKHKHDKEKTVKEPSVGTPEHPNSNTNKSADETEPEPPSADIEKHDSEAPPAEPQQQQLPTIEEAPEEKDHFDIAKADSYVDLYGDIELELNNDNDLDFEKTFEEEEEEEQQRNVVLPEISKWERDDIQDNEPPQKENTEKRDENNTNVSKDVIKRAENVIYHKNSAISKLDELKNEDKRSKSSSSRRSEEKHSKNHDKRSLESKIIPSSNFELHITDGGSDSRRDIKSFRLQSKASPVRVSIKDRLGEKVQDSKSKPYFSGSGGGGGSSSRDNSRDQRRPAPANDSKTKERLDGGKRRSRSRSIDRRNKVKHQDQYSKNSNSSRDRRRDRTPDKNNKKERENFNSKDRKVAPSRDRKNYKSSDTESSSESDNTSSSGAGKRSKKEKKKKRSHSRDSTDEKKHKKRSKSSKHKKKKH